jgi:hypothetical protein
MKRIIFIIVSYAFATITVAQNVGIGTSTPLTKLHIINPGAATILRVESNATSLEAGLELKSGALAYDFLELRKWPTSSGGSVAGISLAGLSSITTGTHSTGGLLIGTKPAQPIYFTTDNIERMQIGYTGQVGIGTAPTANMLSVVSNSGDGISGRSYFSPLPGNYVSGVRGDVDNTSLNAAGITGNTHNAGGISTGIVGGMYGVVGTAIEQGFGIGAFGATGAGGIYSHVFSGTGKALRTFGALQFEGIGAAVGNVLTSDASGNATWQSITGTHNHFSETWSGDAFAGLVINNNRIAIGGIGLFASSTGPAGVGLQGTSTATFGTGVLGMVTHGEGSYPSYEPNSAVVGITTTGNAFYGISQTGYVLKAEKINNASSTGPIALFANYKTTNASPVVTILNNATNPTSLELNNGFIKVSGTNKMAFVHTTTAGNINGNISVLSYANAAATDMVFVTHNYSPVNTYFNYNYGVYWTGIAWSIYIETPATPMPININFNVMVIKQ